MDKRFLKTFEHKTPKKTYKVDVYATTDNKKPLIEVTLLKWIHDEELITTEEMNAAIKILEEQKS